VFICVNLWSNGFRFNGIFDDYLQPQPWFFSFLHHASKMITALKPGTVVSHQQTANQRRISNTNWHKKSPLENVQAGTKLIHTDYCGLLTRIHPTDLPA
jgi:hypothetical protein